MVTYLLGQGSDPNKAPQVVNSNLSGFSLFPPQQPQPQPQQPTPGGGATAAAAGPAPLGQAPQQQQQQRPRPGPDHDGALQPPAEKRGHTALHYAAHNGHAGCVSLLLRYGADPNVRDGDGITPLHSASHNGKFESVLLLLHFEGDDDTIDDEADEADDEEACEVREVGDLDAAHYGRRQEIGEEREPTSVVKAKKPYARVRTHVHTPHTHEHTHTRTHTQAHTHVTYAYTAPCRIGQRWTLVTDGATPVRHLSILFARRVSCRVCHVVCRVSFHGVSCVVCRVLVLTLGETCVQRCTRRW
jgi:hypothetical protein